MHLPIGFDDFGEILENKLDFIDKTLFIKDIFDDINTTSQNLDFLKPKTDSNHQTILGKC